MDISSAQSFEFLKKACLAAAKIQLENYNQEHTISQKEIPSDLVTEIDVKSQESIIDSLTNSMISAGFKEDEIGFIGEENVVKITKHLFIIDPLDGTNNYIERNGNFCISIAYLVDDKLISGMIYRPTEDTFYYASNSEGSFIIKDNIKDDLIIKSVPLKDAMVAYNSSPWPDVSEKIFKLALNLVRKVKRIRETRSAVLTSLSIVSNKFNVAINGKTKIWDIAAAKIIIEEAGGLMTDWEGNEIKLDLSDGNKSYAIISTHKELLGDVLKIINQ